MIHFATNASTYRPTPVADWYAPHRSSVDATNRHAPTSEPVSISRTASINYKTKEL